MIEARSKTSNDRLSTPVWRKIVFSLVVVVFFFLGLELLLTFAGFEPERYVDDPYVGFSSMSPLFVERPGAGGAVEMETASDKVRLFNMQRFARSKPDGTTRVFCVGGSTTFGRPYDDATSFCGWLRELLPVADPTRQWEVVNAGGISYASYRVAVLIEELIRYEPDLFIVYSGHNEFLERRTYGRIIAMPPAMRGAGALLARTRVHAAVKKIVDMKNRGETTPADDASTLEAEVTTMLDDAVGPDAYTRNDEQRERVFEHFRYNLARMVDIARSVGAETVMVTPAANLRDCTPFKSEHRHDLSESDLQEWKMHVTAVNAAVKASDAPTTVAELAKAMAIDDRVANLHFSTGRIMEALNRHEEARAAFARARDEDICPLRALGPMKDLVAEVAADRHVALADFAAVADEASPYGIPGSNLFLDHVHPTVRAHLLLARTVIDAMIAAEMLKPAPGWDEEAVERVARKIEGGIDREAHGQALMKLSKVLGWAGKIREAYDLARQAVELSPNDVRVQYQAGLSADLLHLVDESIEHYSKAIEIEPDADLPHGNLGVALEKKGDLEGAIEHHRIAVRHATRGNEQRHLENLAMALYKFGATEALEGRFERAVEALSEAHTMLPGNLDLLLRLGTAQFSAGDLEAAEATFSEALDISPDNAMTHNRLAIALMASGKKQEAAAAYRKALTLDPALALSPAGLEGFLRRSGQSADANWVRDHLLM